MRIIAPANNNKHYIIQRVSLSLIDFKATKSPALASRVLRLHQTPLTKVTDFSSKQQEQLNRGTPQAEDRQGWGRIQQLWKWQGLSGKALPFLQNKATLPILQSSTPQSFCQLVLHKKEKKKVLLHPRSGKNFDLDYVSKTYLHLNIVKFLGANLHAEYYLT